MHQRNLEQIKARIQRLGQEVKELTHIVRHTARLGRLMLRATDTYIMLSIRSRIAVPFRL